MNRPTVLVIDDDAEFRDNVVVMLESRGFRAVGADSGSSALKIAATEQPAVILCDLLMPAMNGIDVLVEFRNNEITRHTAMVMMSGLCGMDQAAGMPVLPKPFTADDLISAIEHARSCSAPA